MKQSPKDDITQDLDPKLKLLNQVATSRAEENEFPRDISEEAIRPSKQLGAPTPGARADTTLPLPEDFRILISNARKATATKPTILPPQVRHSYKVPRRDWAFLGAVRRPNQIQESYFANQKVYQKGVSVTGFKVSCPGLGIPRYLSSHGSRLEASDGLLPGRLHDS